MSQTSQDEQQLNLPNLDMPIGLRLRRAREAAGMSVGEVASRLRLKVATIEALEKEDLEALGAAVYVRGYFNSYARLVGVPPVLVDGVFAARSAPAPQLQSSTRVSHARYLFDRYAMRAAYVVLTAAIVVPVIVLSTSDQLPRPGALLTPLDAPSGSAEQALSPDPNATTDQVGVSGAGANVDASPRVTRSAAETPVIASLGPFYSPTPAAPTPQTVAPTAPLAPQGLSLELSGPSWIEVLDPQGRRIEHGVLQAGDSRQFSAGEVGKVSIGNANAVTVRMNGAETDIAAYRRANVARFTVSSDGSLAPAGG
jgi:cytoskeleton protein RodZ